MYSYLRTVKINTLYRLVPLRIIVVITITLLCVVVVFRAKLGQTIILLLCTKRRTSLHENIIFRPLPVAINHFGFGTAVPACYHNFFQYRKHSWSVIRAFHQFQQSTQEPPDYFAGGLKCCSPAARGCSCGGSLDVTPVVNSTSVTLLTCHILSISNSYRIGTLYCFAPLFPL